MDSRARILIVSDTHGDRKYLAEAIDRVQPDELWHLGDSEGDRDWIERYSGCPVRIVRGNMDTDNSIPYDLIFDIPCHKVFMTHGHRYGVTQDLDSLKNAAKNNNCDIILFGHIHIPVLISPDGANVPWIVNPGSIARPRQDGREHTYIVLTFSKRFDPLFNQQTIKSDR